MVKHLLKRLFGGSSSRVEVRVSSPAGERCFELVDGEQRDLPVSTNTAAAYTVVAEAKPKRATSKRKASTSRVTSARKKSAPKKAAAKKKASKAKRSSK